MFKKYIRLEYSRNPISRLWYIYATLCLNAWFWSTIFHTRDTPFTQRMDYLSAFSLILFQFYSLFARVFWTHKRSTAYLTTIGVVFLWFFLSHASYLATNSFDYRYNMIVNISVGIMTVACWLVWGFKKYYVDGREYFWRCLLSVALFGITALLEVLDFEPIYFFFDAHSLWHISTVFIPFIWYKFLIDDSYHFSQDNQLSTKQII